MARGPGICRLAKGVPANLIRHEKGIGDANPRASEPLHSLFPEMHSDSASKDLPGRILLDMDNDTESTAL